MVIGRLRSSLLSGLALCIITGASIDASANHSWKGYHWSKDGTGKRALRVGDNTTISALWGGGNVLQDVVNLWNSGCPSLNPACTPSISTPMALEKIIGSNFSKQKRCPPVLGQVEVCDTKYGRNGWLGVASVWVSGGHITQGTVKLNDTYFSTAAYNTPAWKNLVACQELGHTFGLDHQDESFGNTNLNSCMDYTNSPASNQWPNYHDFEQLNSSYEHLDGSSGSTTLGARGNAPPDVGNDMNNSSQWGRLLRRSRDGRKAVYELDLGGGHRVFTFVIWAEQLSR